MSNKIHDELIQNVPDFTSWDQALAWVRKGCQVAQRCPKAISEDCIRSLEWCDIEQAPASPFGLYASEKWRKFVLAVFLADLVSYEMPVDQVSFDRLLYVMHAFPQGFRVWWVQREDRSWWPVGYTGWYPMLETAYELFDKEPEKLKDRMVVPNTHTVDHQPYLYLFNYSVAPALKNTSLSKTLMKQYAEDIRNQQAQGLACITVSDEGVRIANRFGMRRSGFLELDGSVEGVYTSA